MMMKLEPGPFPTDRHQRVAPAAAFNRCKPLSHDCHLIVCPFQDFALSDDIYLRGLAAVSSVNMSITTRRLPGSAAATPAPRRLPESAAATPAPRRQHRLRGGNTGSAAATPASHIDNVKRFRICPCSHACVTVADNP